MLLNLFDRPAYRLTGWTANSSPKNSDQKITVLKNLFIDNSLWALTHFRRGMRFPSHWHQHEAAMLRMYIVPFVDHGFYQLPFRRHIARGCYHHVDNSRRVGHETPRVNRATYCTCRVASTKVPSVRARCGRSLGTKIQSPFLMRLFVAPCSASPSILAP